MKKQVLYWLAAVLLVIIGCQKELSFELGDTPAQGSLQSDITGDCLPKSVNGVYVATTPLVAATNTITVQVNVTRAGTYTITTDTVNGYFFRATGLFTVLGATNVTLRSNGTPFVAGVDNFVVSFDGTVCDIAVTVLPAGSGGPAVFTLNGAPGNCTGAVVAGIYATLTPLTAANTVTINVMVTAIGTYNISTTFQGMTFAHTGVFPTIGANTVVLIGSGTPTTGGVNTVPLTVGANTCSFVVNVSSPAVFTLAGSPGSCTTPVLAGVYNLGTALTTANTVTLNVNVTTAGAYTVSTAAVGGMTFSGTGTLALGPQTIILTGTGTPTVPGNNTIAVTAGSSSCSFVINVTGGPAIGTCSGAPGACTPAIVSGFYVVGAAVTAANTVQIQVNVTTAGAYNISTNTVTGFSFSGTGTVAVGTNLPITLTATGTPTTAGTQTFTVTFGTSTCTFTVFVLPNDYFPRTTNSNWSYEFDNVSTDSLYRNVIAPTLSAAGNTYNIFMQKDGIVLPEDSSGYYRRNGGSYFERFDYGAFLGYDNPGWGEYIMVKDDVPASPAPLSNWKSVGFAGTATGNPFNIRFSYTVIQKDVPITVVSSLGSVTYQNVIVVEEKYEVEIMPGVWQDLTATLDFYGKSYFARGIGLIKYESLDAASNVTLVQELRRFQIF